MNEKIEALKSSFDSELKKIANMVDLEALRVNYLGRKGKVTDALKGMGSLNDEQKKTVGRETNELKTAITVALAEKLEALKAQELQREINALPEFDISMPPDMTRGSYHPITLVQRQCEQVFKSMGFTVEDYAEVVTDYECFESLNIPKFHPARDMQDTFYLSEEFLLRTQTSGGQIRTMDVQKPPIKILMPGRVFRSDSDATHSPMFHQMEGLVVDKGITLGDLQGALNTFVQKMFGADTRTRLRPSYFPFTEPSVEVDVSCFECHGKGCPLCKHTGWIEVLGGGVVNRKVLENCNIDPDEYSGFAFGIGIERIAMLKYGINNIGLMFENNLQFLKQFHE